MIPILPYPRTPFLQAGHNLARGLIGFWVPGLDMGTQTRAARNWAEPGLADGTYSGALGGSQTRWGTGAIVNQGNPDYIDCGNVLSYITNFSVGVMFQSSGTLLVGDMNIFTKGYDGTNTQWYIKKSSGGPFYFGNSQAGTDYFTYTQLGVGTAAINTAYVLLGTYDGTTYTIYANGVRSGFNSTLPAFVGTTNNIRIGSIQGLLGASWDGVIIAAAHWKRSLTYAESIAWTQDPFAMFRPVRERAYLAALTTGRLFRRILGDNPRVGSRPGIGTSTGGL
jgi:hypothetical protein